MMMKMNDLNKQRKGKGKSTDEKARKQFYAKGRRGRGKRRMEAGMMGACLALSMLFYLCGAGAAVAQQDAPWTLGVTVRTNVITVTTNTTAVLSNNPSRIWAHVTNSGTNAATVCYSTNCVWLAGDWLNGTGGSLTLSIGLDPYYGPLTAIVDADTTTLSVVEGVRK